VDGFTQRKEQKKQNIRRAATELFREYGFNKVSIGEIAREAHVSHVTIYNHFGSKEELVRDVIRTVAWDTLAKAREIIDGDRPFLEKLNLLIFNKSSVAGQYQGEMVKTIARDYPEMKNFINELYESEIIPLINRLVEEGKRLKYINPELSPKSVRFYFEIVKNGIYADKQLLDTVEMDTKLAHDLNYLFIFGLIEKQEE
jgi:AcrR family transcriptional regulator